GTAGAALGWLLATAACRRVPSRGSGSSPCRSAGRNSSTRRGSPALSARPVHVLSAVAEPAVELPVVPAVHVAVPVEVEVPQVPGLAGGGVERGSEPVAVRRVHVTV